MDYKEALILIIASSLGSTIRILREMLTSKIGLFKTIYIVLCGFFISYILHGVLKQRDWMAYYGQWCAIAGVISLDLVDMLIKRLPDIIADKINKTI